MKILQIHTNFNGLMSENGSPRGGLEKVIIDSHNTFKEYGIESVVIDDFTSFSDINDGYKKFDLSKKGYRKSKPLILSFIEEQKADLVIVHGSNKLVKPITEKGIKFLFVDHQPHTSISYLYHKNLFSNDAKLAQSNGSLFYSVSEPSLRMKEENIHKSIDPDFKFDGYLKFQHTTNELSAVPTVDHNGYFVTVGRCSGKDKAPHKIIKYCNSYGIPFKVITMGVDKDSDTKAYYEKWFSDKESDVLVDISREEVLKMISESAGYVSTCSFESAGITAFEALSLGVPVVLFESSKFDHASRMFAEDGASEFVTADVDPIDFLNYTLEERQAIRARCESHNSKDAFVSEVRKIADEIGPNVYTSTSIEDFF